jgi:LysR family transcriptional activator of glutamate synthase operon
MDLRQLRYLVALADERHFTRAAAREHVAQPAVSQQIRRLEAEVGLALVERTTRRVALTEAGELLVARARRAPRSRRRAPSSDGSRACRRAI